jgi:hypothetical protein
MIKLVFVAILLMVTADMAITRGENTRAAFAMLGGLAHFVAHMGSGSLFTW